MTMTSTPDGGEGDTPTATPTDTPSQTPTDTPELVECVIPSDCDTGFCVDGICCDRPCDGPGEMCMADGICLTPAPSPTLGPWPLALAMLLLSAVSWRGLRRRS